MPADKAVGLIQMAMRAGKVIRGDALIPAIQSGKVKLVLYSDNCGDNRKKKLISKCNTFNVPIQEMSASQFEGISSKIVSSLGISDAGFAGAIQKRLNEQ